MKKVLCVGLFLNAALLAGRFWEHLPVQGEAQGGGAGLVASRNGDADGRDGITINDPIYLLNWLFLGGPEPVPCPAGNGQTGGLPDTGQTLCYGFVEGQGWLPAPCGGAICPGQDGFYATGCPSQDRFVDNRDGTVTDTCTGLMWQKDTADVNGDGRTIADGSDALNWCDALAYCENLSFAGHGDWRLPNVRELQSIVDYGRFDPSINPVFGAVSTFYSTSTSDAVPVFPDVVWHINFFDGCNVGSLRSNNCYVRAVRTGR